MFNCPIINRIFFSYLCMHTAAIALCVASARIGFCIIDSDKTGSMFTLFQTHMDSISSYGASTVPDWHYIHRQLGGASSYSINVAQTL